MRNKSDSRFRILNTVLIILAVIGCMLIGGCGRNENEQPKVNVPERKPKSGVEALQDENVIPDDGIITKEQFETVAGEDREIRFTGETGEGITYTWTFHANQIQNPEDQNLKIRFTEDGLDDIKKNANNANDALMMSMSGKGLICVPTLEVILPESWESDTVLLLKEQNGKLAKVSDVTIESEEETTKLTMTVSTLDGDSYIVGGIVNVKDKTDSKKDDQSTNSGDNDQTTSQDSNDIYDQDNSGSGDGGNDNYDQNDGDGGDDSSGNQDQDNAGDDDIRNDDVANDNSAMYCTISISCATILNNMDNLTAGKEEFVPSNGWILKATTVEFSEGDSVHDILKAVCKANAIHMESSYTPVYDSAYVEGINQLYEFDCGELSGWMYNVNGWFPNYGCSKYTVQDGDVINWVYTCDLGKDVGDNSMY